nr:aspartate/glutamate racemase family protein [Pseudomonas sp. R5(2019)]
MARIGQLYPSGGICDHEPQLMAPQGVRFVTTRVPFRQTSLEADRKFSEDLEFHAQLLADASVDLLAINCTAATLLAGPQNLRKRLFEATGLNSVTTIEAVVAGCRAQNMRRIGLLTPYPQEVVEVEREYFAGLGIEVVTSLGRPCTTPVEQGSLLPQTWLELAKGFCGIELDGVLISCAGIQVCEVLATIEAQLGLPVVSSNQALVWMCLQQLRIESQVQGFGSLFTKSLPVIE